MSVTKRFVRGVVSGIIALAAASAAYADDQPRCFTTESVQGSWSLVVTYGANVAMALATRTVESTGDFTGTFLLNGPVIGSPTGARTITTGTQVGTYAVNCDGTGTITRTLTASNGVVTTQIDDFIITKGIVDHGRLIATGIADAVRVPSALVPGGIFVTRVHTRVPGHGGREE